MIMAIGDQLVVTRVLTDKYLKIGQYGHIIRICDDTSVILRFLDDDGDIKYYSVNLYHAIQYAKAQSVSAWMMYVHRKNK